MTFKAMTASFAGTRVSSALMLGVCIAVIALLLRMFNIGAWPFDGDEFFTLADIVSMETGGKSGPGTGLQGVIPLAYHLNYIGRAAFGYDEFGSRMMSALLGTLSVVVVFAGLHKRLGLMTAAAAALMIAMWHEHLFQSQQLRHYTSTALFCFIATIAGSAIAEEEGPRPLAITCAALIGAFLCHSYSALLFVIVAAGVAAGFWAKGKALPRVVVIGFLVTAVAYVVMFLVFILPEYRNYKAITADFHQGPPQSIPHAIASLVSLLSPPVAVLAFIGFVLAVRDRRPVAVYWVVCALGLGGAVLLLPMLVAYHGTYAFIYALPAFVMAAYAVSTFAGVVASSPAASWLIATSLCLLNVTGTLSYYADGNRTDGRTAVHFVRDRWQPGDQLLAGTLPSAEYYAPQLSPRFSQWDAARTQQQLEQFLRKAPRTWIIHWPGTAGQVDDSTARLMANAALRLQIMPPRLDHRRRTTQVYLYERDRSP